MTEPLAVVRRCFAEEIGAKADLPLRSWKRSPWCPANAFSIPDRGPSGVRGRRAHSRHPTPILRVYVNASIAIDAGRQLFNGLPSFVGTSLATLNLQPGCHVLHVGAGLGYYTAVMSELVRPGGAVLGLEVDEALAARARSLVVPGSPVDIRHGNGRGPCDRSFDAIYVSAGVTHPLPARLDALQPNGRMVLPLTAPMPMMTANIGKGLLALLTGTGDGEFEARVLSYVAIYSALDLRGDALQAQLTASMLRAPRASFTHLTRRPHARSDACFLHADEWCLRRS